MRIRVMFLVLVSVLFHGNLSAQFYTQDDLRFWGTGKFWETTGQFLRQTKTPVEKVILSQSMDLKNKRLIINNVSFEGSRGTMILKLSDSSQIDSTDASIMNSRLDSVEVVFFALGYEKVRERLLALHGQFTSEIQGAEVYIEQKTVHQVTTTWYNKFQKRRLILKRFHDPDMPVRSSFTYSIVSE